MTRPRLLARAAILFSTLIWGTSFVIVQRAIAELPVFHLLAIRFGLAFLVLLPLARGHRFTRGILRDGALLGALLFTGFALQTYGLLGTTPSRSAFLTGISVVFVPLFGTFTGRAIGRGPALGSLIAAAGLYVLFQPAANSGDLGFGWGDGLTLACAIVFAVYVLAVEATVRRRPLAPLALVQFALIALLAAPSLAFERLEPQELSGPTLTAVLVLALLATAAAFVAQLYAQRHLSAVEAGVILTLEPVAAAAFSVAMGAEPMTPQLLLGGGLVVAAMLVTEAWGGAAERHETPRDFA